MYIYTKCFLCVVMVLAALWAQPAKAACETADLALVLADDISSSVDDTRWVLQRDGYVQAFSNPVVIETITGGGYGCIWVTMVQWADTYQVVQSIPWTLIDSAEASLAFAAEVAQTARAYNNGNTCVGCALVFAESQFDSVPGEAQRRVIDISGDGDSNTFGVVPLHDVREAIVSQGITINGLPIKADASSTVDQYYYEYVIGGPSNFMIIAATPVDFGEAIKQKLILEIAGRVPPEYAVRYASR